MRFWLGHKNQSPPLPPTIDKSHFSCQIFIRYNFAWILFYRSYGYQILVNGQCEHEVVNRRSKSSINIKTTITENN